MSIQELGLQGCEHSGAEDRRGSGCSRQPELKQAEMQNQLTGTLLWSDKKKRNDAGHGHNLGSLWYSLSNSFSSGLWLKLYQRASLEKRLWVEAVISSFRFCTERPKLEIAAFRSSPPRSNRFFRGYPQTLRQKHFSPSSPGAACKRNPGGTHELVAAVIVG